MNYSVSDLIIRIKNAAMAKRKQVILPHSRLNLAIGKVLVSEGFLKSIKAQEEEGKKTLQAEIAYEKRIPVLSGLEVVSKPSLRVYIAKNDIYGRERKGLHTLVLSTSIGIKTGKEARKQGVGGELLFEIW